MDENFKPWIIQKVLLRELESLRRIKQELTEAIAEAVVLKSARDEDSEILSGSFFSAADLSNFLRSVARPIGRECHTPGI